MRQFRVWHGTIPSNEVGQTLTVVRAFQVTWRTAAGELFVSPVVGGIDPNSVDPDEVVALGEDDVVNGLYGYQSGLIHSIGIATQDGRLELTGGVPMGDWYELIPAKVLDRRGEDIGPLNPRACGLFGHYDRLAIRGIGVRFMVDGRGPTAITSASGLRIVPTVDAGRPPRLDEDRVPKAPSETDQNAGRIDHVGDPTPESKRPNPNHRRVDVRRIDQWDDTLVVSTLDGTVSSHAFEAHRADPGSGEPVDSYGSVEVHLGAELRVVFEDGSVYTAAPRPAPAAQDGPTWDNVFSLNERVDYLAWAFRGIDISRLAPFNLQEASGALGQEVFRSPPPGSRDFHVATNGKATVVPNGWQFAGDVSGTNKGRTTSAFSDEESRQTWATSLGISAEGDAFGAKVAYKNNSKAHGELSSASSGKTVSTITETMNLSHNIVVDLATVQLAPAFRSAVASLALDPRPERIMEFFGRFGTHYAHAISFGSKAWEQRHETEESVSESMTHGTSQEQSLDVGFHTPEGGGSASVSGSTDQESSDSSKSGSGLDVSSRGSVGSESEPVPVLLEVEDLTHLLSPVFFQDPLVYDDLRTEIDGFLDDFPSGFDYDDDVGADLSFDIAPAATIVAWEGFLVRKDANSAPDAWIHSGLSYEISAESRPFLTIGPVRERRSSAFPPSPTPPSIEGKTIFGVSPDQRSWWVRGGKRHLVRTQPPDPEDREEMKRFFYLSGIGGSATADIITKHPESGEQVTIAGKMLREKDSMTVWWVDADHVLRPVPSEVVVEVLGGWELVSTVNSFANYRLTSSTTPASVEGKMVRVATDQKVYVISRRKRHRVRTDLAIRKRGGWQQVAVVQPEVMDWFPDSGVDAL